MCKKIAKGCGGLAKLRHCVSLNILKNVYHALIHSYLRYSIIVWGNATENILKPLQTIVNKALRIMTFAPFGNIDLQPMCNFLKVLNVKQIFQLETGKFLYKFHSNLLPISIGGYLQTDPYVNRHSYGLRSRTFNQPTRLVRHSRFAENSLQTKGAKMWEDIPDEIKESQSFMIFKRTFKNFLLLPNADSSSTSSPII